MGIMLKALLRILLLRLKSQPRNTISTVGTLGEERIRKWLIAQRDNRQTMPCYDICVNHHFVIRDEHTFQTDFLLDFLIQSFVCIVICG